MSYTDSQMDALDAMVCRWIDEYIDYVGEPWWEIEGDFVDIYYYWMDRAECLMVPVDSIKRGSLDGAVKR